jgi:hypothetical protein
MRDAFEGKDNEGFTFENTDKFCSVLAAARARARAQVYRAALAAGIVL